MVQKRFIGQMLFALSALLAAVTTVPTLAADAAATRPAARDSLFQPADFTSAGKLTVGKDETITFNTGGADAAPAMSGVITGKGAVGVSKGGTVQVAVFTFDSINLAAGAKIEITGDRALVLLSKDAIVINSTLDLSGKPGVAKVNVPGGPGGPGGEGGERDKSLNSAPPPANGGDGGRAMKDNGEPGHGFGAGFNRRVKGGAAGGGGGYGGKGGDSSEASSGGGAPPSPMPGGPVYGDLALAELLGGSGGAGASNDRNFDSAGGGGGGGAIELVSLKSITLGAHAQLLANGGNGAVKKGCGGGGSGGAILLAAPAIDITPGAALDVSGGIGGDAGPEVAAEIKPEIHRRQFGSGGGGGGGRVAIYSNSALGTPGKKPGESVAPKNINIVGGKGGQLAQDGQAGSFHEQKWPGLK